MEKKAPVPDSPTEEISRVSCRSRSPVWKMTLPLIQEVNPPTSEKLNERGGYLSQHVENYSLGGVVSFRSAYTQVGGNPDTKVWSRLEYVDDVGDRRPERAGYRDRRSHCRADIKDITLWSDMSRPLHF